MKTNIIVQNLKCGGCAKTITNQLSRLAGAENVYVNVEDSTVSFEHTESEVEAEAKEILAQLGYPSIDDKNGAFSKAKSYISCGTGKFFG
jgi:copper chaperone CopZ